MKVNSVNVELSPSQILMISNALDMVKQETENGGDDLAKDAEMLTDSFERLADIFYPSRHL